MNAVENLQAPYSAFLQVPWKRVAIGSAIAFAIAFCARILQLPDVPITDELYHLLAAASWVEQGTLAIADGVYTRASAFTQLIGSVHWLSGGSIVAIRVFCVLIGSLLVAGAFAWTARYIGLPEAVIAASFLAFLPGAIFLSQHIRFYSLHALLFFAMAAASYYLVTSNYRTPGRVTVVLGILIALTVLALHLQVTTIIGVAGIALWVVIVSGPLLVSWLRQRRQNVIAAIGAAIVITVALVLVRDLLLTGVDIYQSSAMWNSNDGPDYYHRFYNGQLGAFWSLFPVAGLIAVAVRPTPALFCVSIFLVALVAQSLGGMRAERFLFYAMPFFFIIWGIASIASARFLWRLLRQSLASSGLPAATQGRLTIVAAILTTLAAGFLVVATPATEITVKMLLGRPAGTRSAPMYWDRYQPSWEVSASELKKLRDAVDIVIVSQPLHALYYIGDYDYAVNATMLADLEPAGIALNVDPSTGRPVFADAATLTALMACHDSGLVVVHAPAWRNETRVNNAVADVIEASMKRIELATESDLFVYSWSHSAASAGCAKADSWVVPNNR